MFLSVLGSCGCVIISRDAGNPDIKTHVQCSGRCMVPLSTRRILACKHNGGAVTLPGHWWRCCCIMVQCLPLGSSTVGATHSQHYIRKHYLNTQQSEIEFRAPSLPPHSPALLPPPRRPPPLPPAPLPILLFKLARSGMPFSPDCWSESSRIPCSSSTLKLNQPQFDHFYGADSHTDVQYQCMHVTIHVCVCVFVCICVCVSICASSVNERSSQRSGKHLPVCRRMDQLVF